MRTREFSLLAIIAVSLAVYCYCIVKVSTSRAFNVNVDMARPAVVVWPCEISVIGDSGEKGFRIGPKIGRGWCGEAGGQASYKFYIPEDDKYHIWAYCLWYDECSNAIFAKIDDFDKAIVGNDPLYSQWHWVRGFDIDLKKGTHTLTLSNHSDHIAVQKFLFASSVSDRPSQTGLVFSDIFYDGFDGCDQGNFASWKIISGTWNVQNPDSQTCLIENMLIGQSEDEAFIVYENDDWSSYCLDITIKTIPSDSAGSAVGICFGLKNPQNYYQLRITPIPGNDRCKMMVLKKTTNETINLAEFELPWKQNFRHLLRIRPNLNYIEVWLDNFKPIKFSCRDTAITGGIGLMLKGRITAHFDDIHTRKIYQNNL